MMGEKNSTLPGGSRCLYTEVSRPDGGPHTPSLVVMATMFQHFVSRQNGLNLTRRTTSLSGRANACLGSFFFWPWNSDRDTVGERFRFFWHLPSVRAERLVLGLFSALRMRLWMGEWWRLMETRGAL